MAIENFEDITARQTAKNLNLMSLSDFETFHTLSTEISKILSLD